MTGRVFPVSCSQTLPCWLGHCGGRRFRIIQTDPWYIRGVMDHLALFPFCSSKGFDLMPALPTSQPRLLIAGKTLLEAESLRWCLQASGTFREVEITLTAAPTMEFVRASHPQLVLLGEELAIEITRPLCAEVCVRLGETRVAIFGDQLTGRQTEMITQNSISAILSRRDPIRTIEHQLIDTLSGIKTVSKSLADRITVTKSGRFSCPSTAGLTKLTDRQWDVLRRIALGENVSDVASSMEISAKAVECHKYRIMKRIGATNRVDLCRWAIREGLIEA